MSYPQVFATFVSVSNNFIINILLFSAGDSVTAKGYENDVFEGSEIHLKCEYYSEKGISNVETWWSKNGKIISEVGNSVYYNMNNVTSEHDGNYTCNGRLKTGGDTLTDTIVIKVIGNIHSLISPTQLFSTSRFSDVRENRKLCTYVMKF